MKTERKIVILAGGQGERLWPASRSNYPKFFFSLAGRESLIIDTIKRGLVMPDLSKTVIVTNTVYKELIRTHIDAYEEGYKNVEIIAEPSARNTAPAIALAARNELLNGRDPVLFIFPADHYIPDASSYSEALEKAYDSACDGYIVTLGIKPSFPSSGYGYIECENTESLSDYFKVRSFKEKPDKETAEKYISTGRYFWNAGVFIAKASTIFEEMEKYSLEIAQNLSRWRGQSDISAIYNELPKISFDCAVMEHTDKASLVPYNGIWEDLGSWESVKNLLMNEEDPGVFSFGPCESIDSDNVFYFNYSGKKLIASIGVKDIIVVDSEDTILILKDGHGQSVKDIYKKIEGTDYSSYTLEVRKPWGSYKILEDKPGYKIKILEVLPGKRLSLQKHKYRSETWTVLEGQAIVTLGTEEKKLDPGSSVKIGVSEIHRAQNSSDRVLKILEVAKGDIIDEDDIVRLEDDYQRINPDSSK